MGSEMCIRDRFLGLLPSKLAQKDNLEGKKRQRKMNFEIFFDACRNIYGKSSSTF